MPARSRAASKPYSHVLSRLVSICNDVSDKQCSEEYIIYTALKLLEYIVEYGIPDDLGYMLEKKDPRLVDTIYGLCISRTISKMLSTARKAFR